jgi:magnesium transporter
MARKKRRIRDRIMGRKRSSPGASPGTLVADPESKKPVIRVLAYGPDGIDEAIVETPETLKHIVGRKAVTWIDVDGLGDAQVVDAIGKALDLHPLALEDAINLNQRPKVDEYESNLFVVLRMARLDERLLTEQLSFFLGANYVITFQGEHPGDCLDPVRQRIHLGRGRIRNAGAAYLAYALVDAVIDHYFPILDDLGESLEHLEDELICGYVPGATERIQKAKQDLLVLRRAIVPTRDVCQALTRDEGRYIDDDTQIYLRDCFDHASQLNEIVGTYRELAGGLMDLYLSGVSNRTNDVMKVLTLVSTIFMPLTFIVGVYGMNFDPQKSRWNMPELENPYGYPIVVGVMFVLAVALFLFFKRKGWLSPTR